MDRTKTLFELKKEDLKRIKNRPAINVFKENMSLGAILEKAYVVPKYYLRKNAKDNVDIKQIYNDYYNKNILFIGEGGVGKTSSFLRLYMGSENNGNCFEKEFYYCFAPDLLGSKRSLNNYQKELRNIVENNLKLDGILLIDGLEEAFLSKRKQAADFLIRLNNCDFTIWVACRTNFYKTIEDKSYTIFEEIIDVKKWDDGDYESFVSLCLADNANRDLIEKRINRVKDNIKELLLRPLFATMIVFLAENNDLDDIDNEYELIDFFIKQWFERDAKDKKNKRKLSQSDYKKLREIALKVYLEDNSRPQYDNSLSLFRDLFVMTNNSQGTIHGFLHREFLIYFIVNALLNAALLQPKEIIRWYSQTFYDDITNVIKPELLRLEKDDIDKMYVNLFKTYRYTYEYKKNIIKDFKRICVNPDDKTFLRLRDEILYFIFRLPSISHDEFAEYAYKHYLCDDSKDIMLFLGIAYGMAISNPNNFYTFEFAKKLIPGNPEEIRNRGWGMCFFGDVDGDGYTYLDNEKKPWNKVRENRLLRLSDNEKRYVTRTLDLPLLYCYYFSRDFQDCISYREYCIIKNTNISLDCFGEEQKEFLINRKKQLVETYLEHLLSKEIQKNYNFESIDVIEDEVVDNDKIIIKIDKSSAEKILKQTQYTEDVKKNLKLFYERKGENIIKEYGEQLCAPPHNNISNEDFEERLKKCKVIVISANSIEGAIISRRISNGDELLDAFPYEGHLFQFASLHEESVCHIWPSDTSSFTQYGSFSALNAALEKVTPDYVISVGVAFGTEPNKQKLGDVLVSKELVFYDHFNKAIDGSVVLKPNETYRIDGILNAQLHILDTETPPSEVGDFKWYYGSMISGGTVLSDATELAKLREAAKNIGYKIVGGEMEASGIYYACQKQGNRKIPFMIIKGICDWGAVKNGWAELVNNDELKNDCDKIKNCIQAYACDNAFKVLQYVVKQLNFQISTKQSPHKIIKNKSEVKKEVQLLLLENHQIWEQYGPESSIAIRNPGSVSSHKKWEEEKLNKIIPNNKQIIQVMMENAQFFSTEEIGVFMKFKTHAEAFEDCQMGKLEAKDAPVFPMEFETMINSEG